MNATTKEGAREALNRALTALDIGNIQQASNWAWIAKETMDQANVTPGMLRKLVAPRDKPTKGGVAVAVVVGLILLAVIGDIVRGGWLS